MESIDDKIRAGRLSEAYFEMQDIDDYCETNSLEVNRSYMDWIALKEAFILIISYCIANKDIVNCYNMIDEIILPSYFHAELSGLEWAIKTSDNTYVVDVSKISTDGIQEILLNYQEKL